jgi:alkanesulfonate monooxygenase SsuD/methylene tetrahydromethanopterin reductase-like flavin-dependent oxidoreductase (luciferase family)
MIGMRHGVVLLPEHPWARARDLWARAEELGFDHAWTYDHVAWRALRDKPWYGTVATLTAAAATTSRITLGPLVASPALRHPAPLARELMALDDISGGRLICGLGAGGGGHDEVASGGPGLSPAARADRFEEFVELTDLLLRQRPVDFAGSHFTSVAAPLVPGCVQRPRVPFAIAATGPRGMRLAARYAETWVTAGTPGWGEPMRFDEAIPLLREHVDAMAKACAGSGRDPATLRRMVVTGAMILGVTDSVAAHQDACGMFADLGFTDVVVHWPRDDFPYKGDMAVFEDIARSANGR